MSNAAHWSLANAAFMGAEALDFRARYEDDPEQRQVFTEAAERLRIQVSIETEPKTIDGDRLGHDPEITRPK